MKTRILVAAAFFLAVGTTTNYAVEVAPEETVVLIDLQGNLVAEGGGVAPGTISACSLYEAGGCISACLQNGPGPGQNAPRFPVLVDEGCYRQADAGGGYDVFCACTWRQATRDEIPCLMCS